MNNWGIENGYNGDGYGNCNSYGDGSQGGAYEPYAQVSAAKLRRMEQRFFERQELLSKINKNHLISLGFSAEEISVVIMVINNLDSQLTLGFFMANINNNLKVAQKLKYMIDIIQDKISIDTDEELIRHLKKINISGRKVGIQDLSISKIKDIPRLAVVAGIPSGPYEFINSVNQPISKRAYEVSTVGSANIMIQSERKPVLKFRDSREIEGVLKLGDATPKGVEIAVNKKYARMLNRFMIIGTLRVPEFHHGCFEIICYEGTKAYVFANTLNSTSKVRYNGGTQRVYEYGYLLEDIMPKLNLVKEAIATRLRAVKVNFIPANSDFQTITNSEESYSDDLDPDELKSELEPEEV